MNEAKFCWVTERKAMNRFFHKVHHWDKTSTLHVALLNS